LPLGVEAAVVEEVEEVVEALKLAFEWAVEEEEAVVVENDVGIVPVLFDY
jgi:hypothetical protein